MSQGASVPAAVTSCLGVNRQPPTSHRTCSFKVTITAPPSSHQAVNSLILLHGLGNSNQSFGNLGRQLSLPKTLFIFPQAPTPLPLDVGVFHGGDDIVFDQAAGPMDIDTAFKKSGQILTQEVIKNVLLDKCGYRPRDILLFGFGMAALAVVAPMADELGGLISIGGPLPSVSSTASSASRKCMTPVLIIGGSSKTLVTKSAMASLKLTFESVQYTRYTRDGDSMPRNREEMLPIMQFFSPSPKPERSSGGEVEVT